MSTIDILELKKDGEKFFPQTHIDGVVGNDMIGYLGQKRGEAPDGGDPGGGGKKLSVSPRQSVVVNRAIPHNPRKGKKYFFSDGFIKVKSDKSSDLREEQATLYDRDWNVVPWSSRPGPGTPVIVTILDEGPFSTEKCMVQSVRNYNSSTESPFLEIINGRVVNTQVPNFPVSGDSMSIFPRLFRSSAANENPYYDGRKIYKYYPRQYRGIAGDNRLGNSRSQHTHLSGYGVQKRFLIAPSKIVGLNTSSGVFYRVYIYRRKHRSIAYQKLKLRRFGFENWKR